MDAISQLPYLNDNILENLGKEDGNQDYINISKQVAKDLSTRKLTFLIVIEKLQGFLLSHLVEKRKMGVYMLSEILMQLDNSSLNSQELPVIASYFCEKLKDHHEVAASSFKGTLALVNITFTPSESVVGLLNTIFNHVACQQQSQSDRLTVYHILEATLNRHANVVNSMGIDFVSGLITIIDGERDPYNLKFLFNWLPNFLNIANLEHLTEEMFDVLSCYFPVDFKPPQNDAKKITRESLAESLCKCLTCKQDFGQYGIPLALEKLDTTLKIAIEDSLDILQNGCINYSVDIYNQHSIEIWSELQKKIFSSSEDTIKNRCLDTLGRVISKLSNGDPNTFENFVIDITDTLKGNMLPDSKLFRQTAQILLQVSAGSDKSSLLVAKSLCPLLENTFKIDKDTKHKAAVLHYFVKFIKTAIEANLNTDFLEIENNGPILCSQAILSNDLHLVAEGFHGFTELSQFLSMEVLKTYMENLHEVLLLPLADNVKEAVLKSFHKMAREYPHEVASQVLHKEHLNDLNVLDNYLACLGSIVMLKHFEEYVTETLIYYATTQTVSFSMVALKHLNILLASSLHQHLYNLIINKDFLMQLLEFLEKVGATDCSISESYLMCLSKVIQHIVRSQEAELQRVTYLTHSSKHFGKQELFVAVLCSLIIPLKVGVFDDYEKIDFLLNCIVNGTSKFVESIVVETLGNIFNKLENGSILEDKLNLAISLCKDFNKDVKIWLISWVTKGLVTRNHIWAMHWVDLLIDSIKENNQDASKGIRIIMDDDEIICKGNNCRIMQLYKQKCFVYCMNKLGEMSPNNDAQLCAAGYLIEKAPKIAIVGLFKKIFRLILMCLESCKEPDILEVILHRITEFVLSGETVIQDNLEDILSRVLDLTIYQQSMSVRIAAIQCVQQIVATYKVYQLLPFKQRVINRLGECVDDKKRLVRKQAMECRSIWYLLDAPV